MRYNYWNLSDIEFEELGVSILLKKEWKIFESFKKWKDWWIDLIYSKPKDDWWEKTIVQCKHYFTSTLPVLKSHLYKDTKNKKSELTKLKELNKIYTIERYILICSHELNHREKNEILDGFEWFIKTTWDIISLNDIDLLIDSKIEKKHFKLWLNSYTVVERLIQKNFNKIVNLFNKGIKNRSTFTREEILDNLKKFVAIPKINDAKESLNKNNVVIISWEPWIGKTTLAKVLLLEYFWTRSSYEFIEISEDIKEWFELFDKNKKQIFYYDDFLWKSAYQWGNKNEAHRINQFIEKVTWTDYKKLIFTTREYILRDAEEQEDDFNLKWIIEANKMLINIEDYWFRIKGKILYNHIYFSDLGKDYTSKFFEDQNYLKIIQHKNYTPRLIEQFTKKDIINNDGISSEKYIDFILSSLDNPEKIWKTWFQNINNYAQNILIILNLYEYWVEEKELHINLNKFLWIKLDYLLFKNSLKLIEWSFISIDKKRNYIKKRWTFIEDEQYKIYYKNPSVWDFILNEIIKKDLNIIDSLIKLFINKEELYDFLNRYFTENKKVKNIFTEQYLLLINNENNIENKANMYLNAIKNYSSLIDKYDELKEKFKLFLDNEVFPIYKTIDDKSLFIEVSYIFNWIADFHFFYEELFLVGGDIIKDIDKEKLIEFWEELENHIYDFELYKDYSLFTKICSFYEENELKFKNWEDIIKDYMDYHSLDYHKDNSLEDIENNIYELESLNSDSVEYFFSSFINEELSVLDDELKKRKEEEEPEDNINEPDFDIEKWWWSGDSELEYIINLYER